ncbi:MAG: acyl-CoA dehydrogenase family protein, partial [Chloroflexota bacterium]|nr:acyl-CoA dehydrogenase family protein [Chloroflexota bacterium]
MDFRFSPEEEKLRQDIREFAERELPPDWAMIDGEYSTEEAWQFTQAMSKKLAARGWLTMAWPKQYGGRGVSHIEQAIYRETAAYYEIPGTEMGVMGVAIVGPSLMLFGSEDLKREHLPRIAAGERYWCTGYSEPGAGSDLASLQTRAVEDGDDFVINGQKVWTSAGHRAHWCWLAARTDPQVPKHKGISLFLVDMKSPGITVRPLINVMGRHDFNEVFFENVRVPKRNLVGQKNRGWYYVAVALDFERSGVDRPARCRRALERLMEYCQETKPPGKSGGEAPLVRHRLAEMALE